MQPLTAYFLGLLTVPAMVAVLAILGIALIPDSRSWGCMICDAESEGQPRIWSWTKRRWHARVTAKQEWHRRAYAERFPAHVQHPLT